MSDALFRAKAPGIMNLLMADFALDLESAAAILGNLGHESGGFAQMQELAPTVAGSAGGWGWAQWTGPRRRAFEDYADRNGYSRSSDTANYKWLFLELSGTERGAISAVKNAVGLEAKVRAFEAAFERAGIKHYERRYEWARKALDAYQANPGGRLDIQDAATSVPIPLPPITSPSPAGNPLGGVIEKMQGFKAESRKIAMGVIGAHNMFYPDDLIVVQAPAPPPPPPAPSKTDRPSVQLGFAGVIGSLIAMATGHLGTPLGMGVEPTTAGNVVPLVSALVGGVGMLGGGWAGLLAPVLKMVGGLASKATKP